MKIANNSINNFIHNLPSNIKTILLFGKDNGLAEERIALIKKTFLGNNFNNAEAACNFYYSDVKDNFAKVVEELNENSLFWRGKKMVVIRYCSEAITKDIKSTLTNNEIHSESLLVLHAEDLSATSNLRKFYESDNNCAALPCYLDDERTLRAVIIERIKNANYTISEDAINYLVNNLGNNRGITNKELEKLLLYKHNTDNHITLEDVSLIIDANLSVLLDKIHFTLFNLEISKAYRYIEKLLEEENAIFIIRGLANHVFRLLYAKSLITSGKTIEEALKLIFPPIFFTYVANFKQQISLWSLENLQTLLKKLIDAEIYAKLNSSLGDTIVKDLVVKIGQQNII